MMKKILVIGLGGSGTRVVNAFFAERHLNNEISFFAIDSDVRALERITDIPTLCLTEYTSLGNVLEKLDPTTVSAWFPCDPSHGKVAYFKTLEMGNGANGWRMKGLLSFEYMLSDPEKKAAFLDVLDQLVDQDDPNNPIQIILVSSLIGGTGSALYLPVAMYIQRYFKSKYDRNVEMRALVSCPDVYVEEFTSENRARAYANAYAAFKELNAVDLVSKGYNKRAETEGGCKVGFKIGAEESAGIGVLFDASKPKFSHASAQPFQRVYLFDRIPGMGGVEAHESTMAKLLGIILEDDSPDVNSEIYAGISLGEVVYAHESIVDYVAIRKVYDELDGEWLPLYREAQDALQDLLEPLGPDDTYTFSTNFTAYYKDKYATKNYHQHLILNREKDDDFLPSDEDQEPIISSDYVRQYLTTLTERYSRLFDERAQIAEKELNAEDADLRVVRWFDRKSVRQRTLCNVRTRAEGYLQILLDFFKEGTKIVEDRKEAVQSELFDEKNDFSLCRNLLCYEGKYLHPVTGLLLLSEAYVTLKEKLGNETELSRRLSEHFAGKKLPNFVFEKADFSPKVHEAYQALGENRLQCLVQANASELSPKIVQAFPDVKRDLRSVYRFIKDSLIAVLISRAVAELIQRYREIFNGIPGTLNDHRVDVKLALRANTKTTCTRMNVGCSEENKQEAYARFCKDCASDCPTDEVAGELVFESAKRGDGAGLFRKLVEKERSVVLNRPFMQKACGHNVLRVLHNRDLFAEDCFERSENSDIRSALALVALPLDVTLKKESLASASIEAVTMMPLAAAEFAHESLHEEELSLQEALDRYLFLQRSYESKAVISKTVPNNRVYSIQKIYGFPLYLFNKVNESYGDSVYYQSYKKILRVKKEQFSQMWNPHLVIDTAGSFFPFIDPVKRAAYEFDVYKAGLYMLRRGHLFVDQVKSGQDIFYHVVADQRTEIYYENAWIRYETPERLFGFLRENFSLVEGYGAAFDADMMKEIALLPGIGYEEVDIPKFRQAILNSKTMQFFRGNLMANIFSAKELKGKLLADFLYDAAKREATQMEAKNLATAVAKIIKEFVFSRALSGQELYEAILREILETLQGEYEKTAKKNGDRFYKAKSKKAFSLIEEALF